MQSFKSAVFTAFAALFLAVSLSGCSGDEKTASQSGENGSSLFESGEVELVLRPGVRSAEFTFQDDDTREAKSQVIVVALEKSGVIIDKVVRTQLMPALHIYFKPISSKVNVELDKTGLVGIIVQSPQGRIATWNPATSDEVQYAE